MPTGSPFRLVPVFWTHPDRMGSGSQRQSLDVTHSVSGKGAVCFCSMGGCDTTGSEVGGDMLALCPLLRHSGQGLSNGWARKV